MSNLLKILCVCAILSMPLLGYGSSKASISTKLDSTVLLMGKQTALHIEILQGKDELGAIVNLPADTLCQYVEIAGLTEADTVDLGNDRIQIKRDLILQSFDSGLYVLPPLQYVVKDDTSESEQLSLKVMPVNVDTLTNIHPYKSVESFPFHLIDYLPDFIADYWWIYLILVLIIAIGVIVYIYMSKKPVLVKTKVPQMSPYDEAMLRLEELKNRKLWQGGQEKEYYTILTDILRNYIDRRFGVNAMEMTSSQIIATLRHNHETKAVNEQLNQILEMADFVKFAKVRPLPDDNEATMRRAINFVTETRPVPTPEDEAEGDKEDKTTPKKEAEGGHKA